MKPTHETEALLGGHVRFNVHELARKQDNDVVDVDYIEPGCMPVRHQTSAAHLRGLIRTFGCREVLHDPSPEA